jgi:RimJ/RimL family protein N-acetyltransferase
MSKRKTTKNPPYKSTPRLTYRLLTTADEALYCNLYGDPEVMRYVGKPLSRDNALVSFGKALALTQQAFFQRRVTAIIERATEKVVGISSIHTIDGKKRTGQVGSMLTPAAQAQGYGLEYSRALISYAFKTRPLDKLLAQVAVGNLATEELVTELGFVPGATTPATPDRPALVTWSLTSVKWKKQNKPARKHK